jgi:AraC-like DNA-binding protein
MPDTVKNPALGWISVRHLQYMVARGEAAGLQMDELLAEAGLSRGALADADGLVPLTAIETMLAALTERYADPLIGLHLASAIQPPVFGAIGLVFQSCTALADALDVVVRYNGLLSNIGTTSLAFVPGGVEVRWECSAGGEAFKRQATEYVLGAFAVMARLLLVEHQRDFLQAVHFAHARPADAAQAREYFSFFGCPVHFGRPCSALLIPAAALKAKLRHGDAFLKDLLEQHAQNLLRQRAHAASPVEAVRHLIAAMIINGVPTKDMVAEQLGMSGRSLHRRLQDAGTSYRRQLDGVRLEFARQRLHESSDSLNTIAEHLGFASHQAFLRWFKQSTGQTPGEYRRQHGGHHDD